jgi:hypothetical protein
VSGLPVPAPGVEAVQTGFIPCSEHRLHLESPYGTGGPAPLCGYRRWTSATESATSSSRTEGSRSSSRLKYRHDLPLSASRRRRAPAPPTILVLQFGSFLDPLAIIISLPLSLIGVMLALLLTGNTLTS